MPKNDRYRIKPRPLASFTRMPTRRFFALPRLLQPRKLIRGFIIIGGAVVLVGLLIFAGISLFGKKDGSANTGVAISKPSKATTASPIAATMNPAATLPPRATPLPLPGVTPESVSLRDLSFGARDIVLKERQINQPSYYNGELIFSAGSGSLNSGAVLKSLFIYDVTTKKETKITAAKIPFGEYYETLINKDWLVWLETDHGDKNYIYVMDRNPASNGKVTLLKNCKNGKPKLRLSGNTLIWMEQVDKGRDVLSMIDLKTQENINLFSFTDIATYGVSAPCIVNNTIVWAGPDPAQTPEQVKAQGARSAIFSVSLDANTIDKNGVLNVSQYLPGTYVHEPVYNGKYFAWIDSNKSPNAKLYLGQAGQAPKVIAEGMAPDSVTTYSLGDGILIYGYSQQVWVYVIKTGETCRLTSEGEKGMLPEAYGRTVVWYDITAGSGTDVLRYKILSDQDLLLGASTNAQP